MNALGRPSAFLRLKPGGPPVKRKIVPALLARSERRALARLSSRAQCSESAVIRGLIHDAPLAAMCRSLVARFFKTKAFVIVRYWSEKSATSFEGQWRIAGSGGQQLNFWVEVNDGLRRLLEHSAS